MRGKLELTTKVKVMAARKLWRTSAAQCMHAQGSAQSDTDSGAIRQVRGLEEEGDVGDHNDYRDDQQHLPHVVTVQTTERHLRDGEVSGPHLLWRLCGCLLCGVSASAYAECCVVYAGRTACCARAPLTSTRTWE